MMPTIQEQIAEAWVVTHKTKPTLDELFKAIPDTIVAEGKAYQLQVTPLKVGLSFVHYIGVENPDDILFYTEYPDLAEALCIMIGILNKNVNDSWTY